MMDWGIGSSRGRYPNLARLCSLSREGERSYTVCGIGWRAVMVASVGERSLSLPALQAPVPIRAPPGCASAPVTRRLDSPPRVASLSFRDREPCGEYGLETWGWRGEAQACARLTVN